MSEVVGEVWVAVRPETGGFGPALARDVSGTASAAGARAGREAGQSFSRSFGDTLKTGAALVGVVGAFEAVRESISAAAAHEGEIALLNRAIEDSGASATIAGSGLEDLIRKQALERGFLDEDLYPAFTRIVGATHDSAKAYKDLGLAEDVARQRHVAVGVAALALAKAEQGSVTSLQRLGIILPAHVRNLEGAAKATAALEVVQQRFGGSAAAFADTGAGALARFAEARHLIEESAGRALLPEVEHAAAATADWASKSENLDRVQRDVAAGAELVGGAVKVTAKAFDIATSAINPLVKALGGYDRTAQLVFGALAIKEVQEAAVGVASWSKAVVTGETTAAAATSVDTAAVTANTVAVSANAAAQAADVVALDAATAGFGLNAAAATRGGIVLGKTGAAAGAARTGFLSMAVSGGGLAGVLKSGIAPAAILAGYELSTFIRKIPEWNAGFESLGGSAEKLAEKLGLIGGGVSKASAAAVSGLHDTSVQAKLEEAYKQAEKVTGSDSFAKSVRDKIVAQIVGPGYTFNDARIIAQNAARQAAGPKAIASRGYASDLKAGPAGTPDLDYRIKLQEALATKTTADELAIYQNQLKYVDGRIAALKRSNDLTAGEKKRLLERENEAASLQSAISGIETKAAQDAKAAADKARQAYTDLIGARDQSLSLAAQRAQLTSENFADDLKAVRAQLAFDRAEAVDAKLTAQQRAQYASQAVGAEQQILSINQQIHQRETQAYRDRLSLEEQRLQLGAQRAQLTEKTIADDKAAARKLIAFYTREAHDAKLTESERLQFASQAVQERIALKGLSAQAQGATAQQIFDEAAAEFKSFGSNIGRRSGVLSGQDERAKFASLLLEHSGRMVDVVKSADAVRSTQLLTESQKQTELLARIANAVSPGTGRKPSATAIVKARRTAQVAA